MTEDNLRNEISNLEQQIDDCDYEINRVSEKLEIAISEYKRYGEKAANGGGMALSSDHMRGMADMHYSDAESFKREIRELERRKEKLIRQLKNCRRALDKAGKNNSEDAAYAPESYSTPRSGKTRTTRRTGTIWTINSDRLKAILKTVLVYVLIILMISIAARRFGIAFLLEIPVIIGGPIIFAVYSSKKLYGPGEPKRAAKIFISYCLGIMLTMTGMFSLSISSLILALVIIVGSAFILEGMSGAK